MPSSPPFDAAEAETAARKRAGAVTFDRLVTANLGLVESNVQLVRTVRVAILVVATFAVLSMSWCVFTTYSMRSTLDDMRVILEQVLSLLSRRQP